MARIKLSPILTQASGSIGGITLQRNKYGMTMRQKPLPLNPASPGQYFVREKMIEVQKAWQDLSDAGRLQWNRFLDFSGQTIKRDKSVRLSGHSLFLKYQILRLLSGRPLLTTIAYVPMPEFPVFSHLEYMFPIFDVWFSTTVDVSEAFFLLRLTSPRLPNKSYSPRGLRIMSTDYSDLLNYEIQDPFEDTFGALPAVDDVVHYAVQFYSYKSPIFSGIFTGTAKIQ